VAEASPTQASGVPRAPTRTWTARSRSPGHPAYPRFFIGTRSRVPTRKLPARRSRPSNAGQDSLGARLAIHRSLGPCRRRCQDLHSAAIPRNAVLVVHAADALDSKASERYLFRDRPGVDVVQSVIKLGCSSRGVVNSFAEWKKRAIGSLLESAELQVLWTRTWTRFGGRWCLYERLSNTVYLVSPANLEERSSQPICVCPARQWS